MLKIEPTFSTANAVDGRPVDIEPTRQLRTRELGHGQYIDHIRIGELRTPVIAAGRVTITPLLDHIFYIRALISEEQVQRVTTRRVIAMMKYPQAVWNWSIRYLPRGAMSQQRAAVIIENAVSKLTCGTLPSPTIVRHAYDDIIPNALRKTRTRSTMPRARLTTIGLLTVQIGTLPSKFFPTMSAYTYNDSRPTSSHRTVTRAIHCGFLLTDFAEECRTAMSAGILLRHRSLSLRCRAGGVRSTARLSDFPHYTTKMTRRHS